MSYCANVSIVFPLVRVAFHNSKIVLSGHPTSVECSSLSSHPGIVRRGVEEDGFKLFTKQELFMAVDNFVVLHVLVVFNSSVNIHILCK